MTDTKKELENTSPSSLSFKDKITNFIAENPRATNIGSGILATLTVLIILVYFIFFYRSSMEYYADEFCKCTDIPTAQVYEKSIDGFEYIANMNSCFSNDFSSYSAGMSIRNKQIHLLKFKDFVIKKCPHKLEKIFRNK